VFDKGNNSEDNFRLLDQLELKFVGAVKLDQHRDLAEVPNDDPRFTQCSAPELEGTRTFRVTRKVADRERVLVVTYNQNLFDAQRQTVENDVARALEKLADLSGRLQDRAAGLIKGGRAPTVTSVEKECQTILSRQHLKQIIHTNVSERRGFAHLEYSLDATSFDRLRNTYLGKNILITNRSEWDDERIVVAYRSQFIIENVFKEMKDRDVGTWWPLLHWTDSKIKVHAFYCTVALLLRALLLRRVHAAGEKISMARLLSELDGIREVVTIYPSKRGCGTDPQRTVLTKRTEFQQRLLSILQLRKKDETSSVRVTASIS
jgi:transposase